MTLDVRPVCMFCLSRFSVTPDGVQSSACESWRSLDGQHVERRTATPEQHARLRMDAPPRPTTPYGPKDPDPTHTKPTPPPPPRPTERPPTAPVKAAAPTPFDAEALRAGKPTTPQPGLF